jgi:hypothetical protein
MSRQRTDAELLSDARRDPAAFGELYARHVAAVHEWFAHRLPTAAADLTAETFALGRARSAEAVTRPRSLGRARR